MTLWRGNGGTGSASSEVDTTQFQEFLVQTEDARDAAEAARDAALIAETNAETAETNAETAETNAAASASTAQDWAIKTSGPVEGSEYSAKYNAQLAATSATAAEAALDAFDDRYLGAKASDPTVDNDGNPLITGTQYFDTVNNEIKVYNGTSWQSASVVGGTVTNLTVTDPIVGSITGNAGTVTNGVYTTGSYSNPAWITSLAGSKVSGNISGNAANVTGTVAIANGGTGSTTASTARTALGVAIGTDVLPVTNPSYTGTLTGGTINSAANPLVLQTGGTERARIDSSGNLGLGVTPSAWGSPFTNVLQLKYSAFTGSGNSDSRWFVNSYYDGTNYRYIASANATRYDQSAGGHYWFTAPSGTAGNAISFTQAMTLDASGNLLVGTTSSGGVGGISLQPGGGDPTITMNGNSSSNTVVSFRYNSTQVGSITRSTTATSYNTSSDYRLKESIAPMTGALAKVQALKPVTYKWKADGSAGDGFIAHELAEVCPAAVTGEKDAVDADGNPMYQGIDVSFLVGTLTAAIQEQQAIITAQAAQIQQLREKVLEVEEGTSNMLVENTNNLYETITALTARVAALEAA